uniref:HTH psq-type domain-containing protein n=1 Tax=Anopheles epiroticus TaxID=199890 RepID=A0A182PB85_9DIPT
MDANGGAAGAGAGANGGSGNNGGLTGASTTNSNATTPQPTTPVQIYQHPFSPQIISVNPNSMVNSYQSSNLSTPTSPQAGSDQTAGLVYSTGTPNQSPLGTTTATASGTNASGNGGNGGATAGGNGAGGNGGTGGAGTAGNGAAGATGAAGGGAAVQPVKRKRSVNPQGDENFLRALEAVRFGGIGFCKAARLYGVNNRTLWLEYKKRGYPISRPSIKNRIKLEPNISPPPTATTPPGDENASLEHYDTALSSPALNMSLQQQQQVQQHQTTQQQQQVTAAQQQTQQHQQQQAQQQQQGADTANAAAAAAAAAVVAASSTPLMCPPHGHPMGVMGFLDTRHVDFTTTAGLHQMSRQRYPDTATVNMNTGAVNLQGLNFNSISLYVYIWEECYKRRVTPHRIKMGDMARMALGLVPGQTSSSTSSGASESSVGTAGSVGSSEQSTSTPGGHIVSSGTKRGRLLIRQQRIKKESDSSAIGQQPYEPDTPSDDNSPTAQYGHQNLLTVPSHHRFERQVSEPILPLSSSISVIGGPISSSAGESRQSVTERTHGHLLSVPTIQQSYTLVKQHSHPLLPSQTSTAGSHSTAATLEPLQTYTLQRQLSHPGSVQRGSSTPLTLVTSSSGSTHYLTPSSSLKTDSDEEGGSVPATPITAIPTIQLQSSVDRTGSSPTVVIVPADPVQTTTSTTTSSSIVASSVSEQQTNPPTSTITSAPTSTIRVKGEELSRSISTPLTSSRSTDIPGLDNPRSSHCPVVREGPALGCNFCWNTIDAHGRILRRKTKYHCPECQTNLCIVPCFQEYHERQSAENPTPTNDSGGGTKSGLRHYAKSGSM